jgi:hypothetical protein
VIEVLSRLVSERAAAVNPQAWRSNVRVNKRQQQHCRPTAHAKALIGVPQRAERYRT